MEKNKLRLLVVEDEKKLCDMIAKSLHQTGYEVDTCNDGEEALAQEKNLILAGAMTIWHMPIYKKLWNIVKEGALGKVQIITMNFGSFKEYDMKNRFFNLNMCKSAFEFTLFLRRGRSCCFTSLAAIGMWPSVF